MANSTVNLVTTKIGQGGYIFDLGIAAATHIYEGILVSQLTTGGMLVPYSTALSEFCVGVTTHEQDNSIGTAGAGDKRVRVESMRAFAFTNGAGGDAFADTDLVGVPVYATDDHTVAKTSSSNTRKPVGFYLGFEADGRVRVFINPPLARLHAALVTAGVAV